MDCIGAMGFTGGEDFCVPAGHDSASSNRTTESSMKIKLKIGHQIDTQNRKRNQNQLREEEDHRLDDEGDDQIFSEQKQVKLVELRVCDFVCDFCGKRFSSGKALGGHKRIHSQYLQRDRIAEPLSEVVADTGNFPPEKSLPKSNFDSELEEGECLLADTSNFPPEKSLPKSNFDSELEEGECLVGDTSNFPPEISLPKSNFDSELEEGECSVNNSISSSTVSDGDGANQEKKISDGENKDPKEEEETTPRSAVDLLRSLPGWSRTDRRGKSNAIIVPKVESNIPKVEDDENALNLDHDFDKNENVDNNINSYRTIPLKKREIARTNSNSNSNSSTELKKRKIVGTNSNSSSEMKRYTCTTCEKSFSSFQALGGHRSSHYKSQFLNKQGSSKDQQEHRCKICDKKFLTGQALGGHQRRHWVGPPPSAASANSAITSDEVASGQRKRILLFDLNELPPIEDEEAHLISVF